jgi:AraC family transcriptional regulator, regulatory protein of adaptative response / DNA-3-methyladenine glycosylase II
MGFVDLDVNACYRAFRTRDARFDGRLFSGCRTTGIYCRPVCPARTPKRAHMWFFPTAAAAQEAGFRPCLRCRPETSPDLAVWRGTSNTVSRALSLIEAGALDDAPVEDLAERVGIGERQLRRLFRLHLGATPVAVAQTKRLLLAMQLIGETRLSMADIALASGYASIRRFNEVFKQLFNRSPSSLRRRGSVAAASSPTGISILLRYRPPFDWTATLSFLEARVIPGIEHVSGGRYARTIDVQGVQGHVSVELAGEDALRATIRFPRLSALPVIISRLRRLFDLVSDPESIAAHLSEDAALAPLIRVRPGLRVPGSWDAFEIGVRAVLGQQITLRAAQGLAATLVAWYGECYTDKTMPIDGLTHVFPSPERIASANPGKMGMPGTRARALSALAAAFLDDARILTRCRDLETCVSRLRALPGIGEWTAQYIAMRELREPDAFPADDVALRRMLSRIEGREFTSRELLAKAERWRPWRAYAAQHLWAAYAGRREGRAASTNGRIGIVGLRRPSKAMMPVTDSLERSVD